MSNKLLRRAFERAAVGMMVKDAEDQPWEPNLALRRMLGYDVEEFHGTARPDFTLPEDAEKDAELYREMVHGERLSFQQEKRYVRKDGSVMCGKVLGFLVDGIDAEPPFVLGVVEDVTEHKQTKERVQHAETRYRTLVERMPAVTYLQEIGGSNSAIYMSPQIEDLTGYSTEECKDPDLRWRMVHPEDRERMQAEDKRTVEPGDVVSTEYRVVRRDGRIIWVRNESVAVEDEVSQSRYWQGFMVDITERKRLEDELVYRAFHDPLTGLANRAMFLDHLEHALVSAQWRDGLVAVLFLDLDNFKVVNDSLGHEMGDQLLVAVSRRLKRCLRSTDTLARFGGDEFTILLEYTSGGDGAEKIAERITRELRVPFNIEGHLIFMSTSIGISQSDVVGREVKDLLRAADIALYRAKDNEKARYEIFEPSRDAHAMERLELEKDLSKAIEREEFKLHYQPVFSLQANQIVAMEALLRWEHPERGTMLPANFIPLAEETGLIVPIGRWVLEEACSQVCEWQERYPSDPPLIMGVNISLRQFQHPGLVEDVTRVLRETGLEPVNLALEITESVAMHDVDSTVTTLEKLKSLGVWLVIDDFGTGNSSLSYFTSQFKMEHLKLDGSFVRSFLEDPANPAIIPGLINFAHAVGLRVIAEGVETASQLQRLRKMGCEFIQGYYVSKPLPPAAARELLIKTPSSLVSPQALKSSGRRR